MEKHGLSKWGLSSLFKKLVAKGVITREELEARKANPSVRLVLEDEPSETKTLRISGADLLRDIAEGMPNEQLMSKYKLSRKTLQSVLHKLYGKGLISEGMFLGRSGNKS